MVGMHVAYFCVGRDVDGCCGHPHHSEQIFLLHHQQIVVVPRLVAGICWWSKIAVVGVLLDHHHHHLGHHSHAVGRDTPYLAQHVDGVSNMTQRSPHSAASAGACCGGGPCWGYCACQSQYYPLNDQCLKRRTMGSDGRGHHHHSHHLHHLD